MNFLLAVHPTPTGYSIYVLERSVSKRKFDAKLVCVNVASGFSIWPSDTLQRKRTRVKSLGKSGGRPEIQRTCLRSRIWWTVGVFSLSCESQHEGDRGGTGYFVITTLPEIVKNRKDFAKQTGAHSFLSRETGSL